MSKKIHQKYWSFAEKIELTPIKQNKSFLWFSWIKVITPWEYKYKSTDDLCNEVNAFVNDNHIDNIISFENTAGYVTILDYECEFEERIGGIELTWIQ